MKTAISISCYNRVENLKRLINSLNQCIGIDEHEVYIHSDAPTYNRKDDEKRVFEVRKYLEELKATHIFKKLTINCFDMHMGCKDAVISGISMVFKENERVLHLEDDLVVSHDLLNFIDDALDYYEEDNNIASVSSFTFLVEAINSISEDVFLGRRMCSLGFATWKNRWEQMDWSVSGYEEYLKKSEMQDRLADVGYDLPLMFKYAMERYLDSWATLWAYQQAMDGKYTVFPKKSRVYHYGALGTHIEAEEIKQQKESLMAIPYEVGNAKLYKNIEDEMRCYFSSKDNYEKTKSCDTEKIKYMEYYKILDRWMKQREQGFNIADYFKKHGIKTIALYGAGPLSKHLIFELRDSDVNIEYCIDKRLEGEIEGIKVFRIGQEARNVDCIIVTPFMDMYSIKNELDKCINTNKTQIISIEQLI